MMARARNLAEASPDYDVILSDVWGVVHNGARSYPAACAALAAERAAGRTVVLVTNSPRRWKSVVAQMRSLGVPDDAYDRIVTSGDVTRHLVEAGPRRVFFIGAEREHELFADLDIELAGEDEADVILCTSPYDDDVEGPDDYRDLLARLKARELPFVCANPDIMVERGDRLVYCAGALAAVYAELGGTTLIAGKPHRPIYEAAMEEAAARRGPFDRSRVLAIGDGLATDVKGAQDFGLDVLYVASGIHARHYGGNGTVDEKRLSAYLREHDARPRYWIEHLV